MPDLSVELAGTERYGCAPTQHKQRKDCAIRVDEGFFRDKIYSEHETVFQRLRSQTFRRGGNSRRLLHRETS